MAQNRDQWEMDLEESAQGTDSFAAPGSDTQMKEAREAAKDWGSGEIDSAGASARVESARVRRHLLGDALNELEAAAASASGADGWLVRVTEAVTELGRALNEHIEVTEGDHGLLAEIEDVAPRLSNEIKLIEREHEELLSSVESAQNSLQTDSDPSRIRREVMALIGPLSLHRQRGADLVYEAYNVDIAAGD